MAEELFEAKLKIQTCVHTVSLTTLVVLKAVTRVGQAVFYAQEYFHMIERLTSSKSSNLHAEKACFGEVD